MRTPENVVNQRLPIFSQAVADAITMRERLGGTKSADWTRSG